jgi:hypothetical protein
MQHGRIVDVQHSAGLAGGGGLHPYTRTLVEATRNASGAAVEALPAA